MVLFRSMSKWLQVKEVYVCVSVCLLYSILPISIHILPLTSRISLHAGVRSANTALNEEPSTLYAYAYFSICTRDIRVEPDKGALRVYERLRKHPQHPLHAHTHTHGPSEPKKTWETRDRARRTEDLCLPREFRSGKYNKWKLNYTKYMKNTCTSRATHGVRELKHHRRRHRCCGCAGHWRTGAVTTIVRILCQRVRDIFLFGSKNLYIFFFRFFLVSQIGLEMFGFPYFASPSFISHAKYAIQCSHVIFL